MENEVRKYTGANLGQHLIESVEISLGSVVVQKYTNCQRCHEMFENNYESEFMSLMRQLKNLNGNMKLCYDCDKLTSSALGERGYHKLFGIQDDKKNNEKVCESPVLSIRQSPILSTRQSPIGRN